MNLKPGQKFKPKHGTLFFINGHVKKQNSDIFETIESIHQETITTNSGRLYHISDVENNIINEPKYVNIYGNILPAPVKHLSENCGYYYYLKFKKYEYHVFTTNEYEDEDLKLVFNKKSELNEWLSFLDSIVKDAHNSYS